jgi:hypothetical protein
MICSVVAQDYLSAEYVAVDGRSRNVEMLADHPEASSFHWNEREHR